MFNIIPFGCPWWIVTYVDSKPCCISKLLKRIFPEFVCIPITGTTIGKKQDFCCFCVCFSPRCIPPGSKRGDGNLCRVMIYPNIDESLFLQDIVDALGYGFLVLLRLLVFLANIIHVDLCFFSLTLPFSPVDLQITDLFCLLGVNGKDRKSLELHLEPLHIDILELFVPVGMIAPSFNIFFVCFERIP